MNPGGRGCSEPRLHHWTQAWVTQQDSISKKKKTFMLLLETGSAVLSKKLVMDQAPALWEAKVGGSQGQEFETSLANIVKPSLY